MIPHLLMATIRPEAVRPPESVPSAEPGEAFIAAFDTACAELAISGCGVSGIAGGGRMHNQCGGTGNPEDEPEGTTLPGGDTDAAPRSGEELRPRALRGEASGAAGQNDRDERFAGTEAINGLAVGAASGLPATAPFARSDSSRSPDGRWPEPAGGAGPMPRDAFTDSAAVDREAPSSSRSMTPLADTRPDAAEQPGGARAIAAKRAVDLSGEGTRGNQRADADADAVAEARGLDGSRPGAEPQMPDNDRAGLGPEFLPDIPGAPEAHGQSGRAMSSTEASLPSPTPESARALPAGARTLGDEAAPSTGTAAGRSASLAESDAVAAIPDDRFTPDGHHVDAEGDTPALDATDAGSAMPPATTVVAADRASGMPADAPLPVHPAELRLAPSDPAQTVTAARASGSAGTAAPNDGITSDPVGLQIARALAGAGRDRPVELSLAPVELGHVRLTLHGSDQAMTVVVSAERPETLDLLRRNIESLAQDLRQAGFAATSFTFSGEGAAGRDARQGQSGQAPNASAPVPGYASGTASRDEPIRLRLDTGGGIDLRL